VIFSLSLFFFQVLCCAWTKLWVQFYFN